ncbi:MAG: ATP-dependent helicase C-terminal domain-containing protein [Pseudomonadota bacterium]
MEQEKEELRKEVLAILGKEAAKIIEQWKNTPEWNRLVWMEKFSPPKKALNDFNCSEFLEQALFNQLSFDEDQLQKNYFHSLEYFLDPEGQKNWDRFLPTSIQLSDRRTLPIHYEAGQSPFLQSYIQDFYGLKETPSIAGGELRLTLKLNGPHKRPLQVTQDLRNFWKETYPKMLRELSREYPRHYWPENPQEAKPVLFKKKVTLKI